MAIFQTKQRLFQGKIEDEFGEVAKYLADFNLDSGGILSINNRKIKEFANLLINRSESTTSKMIYCANKVFVEKYKSDINLLRKHPIEIKPSDMFNEKFKVTLLINKSPKNFVIPRNGFYHTPQSEFKDCFFLPISTKRAIAIYPENTNFFNGRGESFGFLYFDDERSISALNNAALLMEIAVDESFVLSQTKYELDELLEFVKSEEWSEYERA